MRLKSQSGYKGCVQYVCSWCVMVYDHDRLLGTKAKTISLFIFVRRAALSLVAQYWCPFVTSRHVEYERPSVIALFTFSGPTIGGRDVVDFLTVLARRDRLRDSAPDDR